MNCEETAKAIRELKIQGAQQIALSAAKSLKSCRNKLELKKGIRILIAARPTEPALRNALAYATRAGFNQVRQYFKDSNEKIALYGSRKIKHGYVVFTHCHSSTVTHLLKKAKEQGKLFEVICTETRPLFQGRITARELVEAGIKTTLIVDAAARFFMNDADMVIVGADAITSEGNVVNKIGTSAIALIAKEARTPFYVAAELLKFDPATMYGDYEKIEERGPEEIWENPPEGLNIRNPAFDVTRRDFIHGIICEEGIISPHSIIEVIHRRYPWIFSSTLP